MVAPHAVGILQVVGVLSFGGRVVLVGSVQIHVERQRTVVLVVAFEILAVAAVHGDVFQMRASLLLTAATVQSDGLQLLLVEQLVVLSTVWVAAVVGLGVLTMRPRVDVVIVDVRVPEAALFANHSAGTEIVVGVVVVGLALVRALRILLEARHQR